MTVLRTMARRSATGAGFTVSCGISANSGNTPAMISGTRSTFTKGWTTMPRTDIWPSWLSCDAESIFPTESSQYPIKRRTNDCFTMTVCTRSTSIPWNVRCNRPCSTSMRLSRRRALKPPYWTMVPTTENAQRAKTDTIAHSATCHANDPNRPPSMSTPCIDDDAPAIMPSTELSTHSSILDSKNCATAPAKPMMPAMITPKCPAAPDKPAKNNSLLLKPASYETEPVATSCPPNTPRISDKSSSAPSRRLPSVAGRTASAEAERSIGRSSIAGSAPKAIPAERSSSAGTRDDPCRRNNRAADERSAELIERTACQQELFTTEQLGAQRFRFRRAHIAEQNRVVCSAAGRIDLHIADSQNTLHHARLLIDRLDALIGHVAPFFVDNSRKRARIPSG